MKEDPKCLSERLIQRMKELWTPSKFLSQTTDPISLLQTALLELPEKVELNIQKRALHGFCFDSMGELGSLLGRGDACDAGRGKGHGHGVETVLAYSGLFRCANVTAKISGSCLVRHVVSCCWVVARITAAARAPGGLSAAGSGGSWHGGNL